MGVQHRWLSRALRLASPAAFGGLVAGCVAGSPAPVVLNGAAPGAPGPGMEIARPMPAAPREGRRIVVRPGQSLSRIAVEYHVAERAIIAANRLTPPYKIEIGQRLLIPGTGGPPVAVARASMPPPTLPPRIAETRSPPEIIQLDGPAPQSAAAPLHEERAAHPPPEQSATAEAGADAAARGAAPPSRGRLPWPVQGRVLAGYGVGTGGAHNDGINIAAARGAPVRAVEAGVVAYAGNELRGYGNLVLIKHPSGFISAYAHCEELMVRKGERVRQGQVIARVGATGGVREPQLHFELRRGKSAVDPREFLAPAPSAAAATPHPS